jgi:NADH-quinone oxidoreductase subunit C
MTKQLSGRELAQRIAEHVPDAIIEAEEAAVMVQSQALFEVMRFLKETAELDFDYLVSITAVDYSDYLEVVYHLVSIGHNHGLVIKTRCYDRDNPVVPSVFRLWQGADFQEREVYDLMGIRFDGHPNLKRIFLWEGFQGYPLRRDYL